MGHLKQFNNFQTSYRRLIDKAGNALLRINMEFYHHDFQSEPFLYIEAKLKNITMEHIEDHGQMITIVTPETIFTFSERNYNTNLSNDAVIFSSKKDDETYCIIEFI